MARLFLGHAKVKQSSTRSQPAPHPASQPASEPASQPASQPASKPASQPASQKPAGRTHEFISGRFKSISIQGKSQTLLGCFDGIINESLVGITIPQLCTTYQHMKCQHTIVTQNIFKHPKLDHHDCQHAQKVKILDGSNIFKLQGKLLTNIVGTPQSH